MLWTRRTFLQIIALASGAPLVRLVPTWPFAPPIAAVPFRAHLIEIMVQNLSAGQVAIFSLKRPGPAGGHVLTVPLAGGSSFRWIAVPENPLLIGDGPAGLENVSTGDLDVAFIFRVGDRICFVSQEGTQEWADEPSPRPRLIGPPTGSFAAYVARDEDIQRALLVC